MLKTVNYDSISMGLNIEDDGNVAQQALAYASIGWSGHITILYRSRPSYFEMVGANKIGNQIE